MSADTRARALTRERGTARYLMAIGGEQCEAASGRTFESIDPYAGTAWATAPDGSAEDVDRAVAAARHALDGDWGRMDGFERAASMRRLAGILERDVDALAEIETRDNGRLLSESLGQVSRLPEWLYWFAGLADKIRGDTIPTSPDRFLAYTRHEPVGVVAAIVPWNAPLLLLMWKLAPALAAGCTVVVKPSDHTPISALELARRLQRGHGLRAARRPGLEHASRRGEGRVHGLDRDGHGGWAGSAREQAALENMTPRVLGYLAGARADGAQVACGGGSPRGQEGLFVEPTVLTGVRPEMTIAQEEVFGPCCA